MTAFFALVRKDIVLHLANRRALLMSLVAPILIAAFFGSLFGGSGNKPANIPVAITDLDRSDLSGRVVAAMRADSAFTVSELDAATAAQQVHAGKLRAAVTLPAGFGAQASKALFGIGDKPEIVLTYDPSQGMALPLVRGLLAQHVMQPVSQSAFSGQSPVMQDMREQVLHDDGMPAQQRQELATMFESIARVQARGASAPAPGAQVGASSSAGAGAGAEAGASAAAPEPAASAVVPGMTMPYTTREVEAAGEADKEAVGYNGYAHSFAGMGVQFILLMGVEMGVALLLMRRLGLWKRLRAAPLSRAQLLGSRVASAALIALVTFAVILAFAMVVFGVRVLGSAAGLVLVLVAFALLTATFGLMIAAIGRTPETTRGLAILATLLLVMLGGAWVPSFVFPPWLQLVSAWTPTHWAIEGLDAMTWRGLPFSATLLPVAVLLAFSAVFGAVALWRFDWEE